MTPIEFSYERIGKYINPKHKTDWLRANGRAIDPKKKSARLGMSGCVVLLTEGDCTLVTAGFVPEFAVPAPHVKIFKARNLGLLLGNDFAYPTYHGTVNSFLLKARFNPPQGVFSLIDLSGQALVKPGQLTMNHNTRSVSVTSVNGIQTTNNHAIQTAFDAMGIDRSEVTRKFYSSLRNAVTLIEKSRDDDLSDKELIEFSKVINTPFAKRYDALKRLQSLGGFFDYLNYLIDDNASLPKLKEAA